MCKAMRLVTRQHQKRAPAWRAIVFITSSEPALGHVVLLTFLSTYEPTFQKVNIHLKVSLKIK